MSELFVKDILDTPVDSNLSWYAPPEGLKELDARVEGNKKLVLYAGNIAIVDVLLVGPDPEADPLALLTRLEDTSDQAMDLFTYPQRHADEEVARNVFDKTWLSEEEIDQILGLPKAA